ncbi:MAG TPA: hypothetical protein PK402_06735 [Tepidisphaeraceae bacterium]|nr:hypothetical protein [Tepidisphaeraceae bacterium]
MRRRLAMFEREQVVFLMIPGESPRILRRGIVCEINSGGVACAFDDMILPMAPGTGVILYTKRQDRFLQCAAVFSSTTQTSGVDLCCFTQASAPVSAETRACYRLSIVTEEIFASLNDFPSTRVVDLSAEGFGIVMSAAFAPGTTFSATLRVGNESIRGQVRIQTSKELQNGKFRYGLLACEAGSPLRKGLQKLSMEVQRARLRRMSRAS